jgi:hypothetical protein
MGTVLPTARDHPGMTLAAEARAAVRERPFLLEALRAGVVNYTAAARHLDLGEAEPVATALRRFAEDLPDREPGERDVRVTMESGVGVVEGAGADAVLSVGGAAVSSGGDDCTGVLATGDVDPAALAWTLDRLLAAEVGVEAAGVAGDALLVAVPRREGADALRVVEAALAGVPTR